MDDVDGVPLDGFRVGAEYDVGTSLATLFLAEGWAEPLSLDAPPPFTPFGPDDPYEWPSRRAIRNHPPRMEDEANRLHLDRDKAADSLRRRATDGPRKRPDQEE